MRHHPSGSRAAAMAAPHPALRILWAVLALALAVFALMPALVGTAHATKPVPPKPAPAVTPQASSNVTPQTSPDTPPLGRDSVLTRLPGGLTVLVMRDERFPLVATRLYVHAGSAYETPGDAGISHVLEHMVFKGTEKRPKGSVSREVEAAGGYINAATSFDYTMYMTDMPARHWKLGMDVARDMAFHSTLDPAELESEKQVVLAELKRGEDSPGSVLFQSVHASALKGTPYARPIIGFENTIKNITVESMRAYIKRLYQPQNMLLVVVGQVNPAEVLAEAERQFAPYVNDQPLSLPTPLNAVALDAAAVSAAAPGLAVPTVTVKPGPWNKVYLAAAFPVPGSGDYQSATLDVLAQLLGGDETSLLYRTYKYERQLVDNISVYNGSFERVGMFMISAELSADKLETFWAELTRHMASLSAASFTKAELDRARLNIENDLYRSKETLSGLASKVGHFQFLDRGELGEINYIEAVRSVDADMLGSAISTWLNPARFSATILAPQGAKVPQQASLQATLVANWPARATTAGPGQGGKSQSAIVDLGQGRTVVLLPDTTLPYVSLDLLFSGGDALLTPEEQGLASLAARVLTTGTTGSGNDGKAPGRDATAINTYLADRAASMGASAGRKSFGVRLQGPTRFSADLFGLMGEVLTRPAFAEDEVRREATSQIAAIRSAEDKPLGLAFRKLPPFLFPGSVYGYDQLGVVSWLDKVERKVVAGYWDRQKVRPWVLAVSGDFDREAVLAFAKTLPVPAQGKVNVPVPAWGTSKSLDIPMPDRKQAHLMLIFKTAPETSPDTPGLQVLEAVLGGMGGPLFTRLRDEQGLGYTVTAFNRQTDETGYMVFYIGTEPDKLEQAEAGFRAIIAEVAKKLQSQADVERGINQVEGGYYRTHQSLASRSGEAAGLTLSGRPLSYTVDQIEKARTVTAEDLRQLVQKYLTPDNAYVVKVLP